MTLQIQRELGLRFTCISHSFRPRKILSGLLALLGTSQASTAELRDAYEVDGTVSSAFVSRNGQVLNRVTREFTLSVKDCLWKIRTYGKDCEQNALQFVEAGTDGTNIYSVSRFLDEIFQVPVGEPGATNKWQLVGPSVSHALRSRVTNQINVAVAQIQSGVAPCDIINLINPVWIAYASGCYYRQSSDRLVKPVWVLTDPNLAHSDTRFLAIISASGSYPYLPSQVIYFNDGKGRLPEGDHTFTFDLDPPYHRGFTNAIFRVTASTNIGGIQLPLAASLTMYCQNAKATSSNDLHICNQYDVVARSIKPGSSLADFRPYLPPKSFVTDRRTETGISRKSGVRYLTETTNQWIIDLGELKQTTAFRTAQLEEERRNAELQTRPLKRSLIVALFCGPIIFLAWTARSSRWRRPPKQNKTKEELNHEQITNY